MADTLNLGPDDDWDILSEVERRFDIKLTNVESAQLFTTGQLQDLIERKYAGADGTQACLSQVAFYRIRRALMAMGVVSEIAPQTPIAVIKNLKPRSVAKVWRRLGRAAELDLPSLETPFESWLPEPGTATRCWLNRLAWVATAAMVVCCFFLLRRSISLSEGFSTALMMVASLAILFGAAALWRRLFGTIPRRLLTIGDLAREAAGHSFVRLAAQKRGSSRSDRWFALTALLRHYSGHKLPITRDTAFYA